MKFVTTAICVMAACLCGAMPGWSDGGNEGPAANPAAAAASPAIQCAGIASEGRKVVYVIDHRGQMADSLDFMRTAIKQSINGLGEEQSFAVVVFKEEAAVLGPEKLQAASDDSQSDVAGRMDALKPAAAQNNMLPPYQSAFEKVLALKPEVIYFLTDDGILDANTLDVVATLNKDQKVRINVLAVATGDQLYEKQLLKLAKDNEGQCKVFQENELKTVAAKLIAAADVPPAPVKFFGVESKGNRIVYVIDHSGSLLDNFDFLREEIKVSIGRLKATQSFAVVAFDEDARVLGPEKLQRSTTAAKRDVGTQLDNVKAQGQNDDMLPPFQHAFEKAFSLKPQVIYFLTDGAFDPKLLDVLKQLNKGHDVIINTLAFVNEEPRYEEQLKQLAKDNDGQYKFVPEKDLGK